MSGASGFVTFIVKVPVSGHDIMVLEYKRPCISWTLNLYRPLTTARLMREICWISLRQFLSLNEFSAGPAGLERTRLLKTLSSFSPKQFLSEYNLPYI